MGALHRGTRAGTPDRSSWLALARHLTSRTGATELIEISGRPGGAILCGGGRVHRAWSPGSPTGSPSLAPSDPPAEAGSRQRIALTVTSDAVFAVAAGEITTWSSAVTSWEPDDPDDSVDAARLVREVSRRLDVSQVGDRRLRPEDDCPRPVRPSGDRTDLLLTAHEREVLSLLDGHLTVSELSFRLDRTLFGVCLDVVHLVERGLVTVDPPGPGTGRTRGMSVAELLRPRTAVEPRPDAAGDHRAGRHRGPAPADAAPARPPLTRRVPGASEAARMLRRMHGEGDGPDRAVEVEGP